MDCKTCYNHRWDRTTEDHECAEKPVSQLTEKFRKAGVSKFQTPPPNEDPDSVAFKNHMKKLSKVKNNIHDAAARLMGSAYFHPGLFSELQEAVRNAERFQMETAHIEYVYYSDCKQYPDNCPYYIDGDLAHITFSK